MAFTDWVRESRERFREDPRSKAAAESARRFVHGGVRRSIDPHVGKSIWERGDWDVLVVCDAARVDMTRDLAFRYDLFPDAAGAGSVWSNASCSIDWIRRNWVGRPEETRRTAYVTANPFADHDDRSAQSADLRDEEIGELRLLYESEWGDIGGGVETVPPGRVTQHAIDVWRRREELGIDRMVIHYMQPHEPFRSRPGWVGGDKLLKNLVEDGATAGSSVYPRVQRGEVSMEALKRAYRDNHRWVFKDINERLLWNLDADAVVVTADHANGLDEWGAWHHPPGRIHPAIRKVPWVPVQASDEKNVTPDVDGKGSGRDLGAQLAALGYTEEVEGL
mgnify:CR=1 FL=1